MYFKIAPIIASVAFSLGVFKLAKLLISNKYLQLLSLILVLFGGSSAYLLALIRLPWMANSFMLEQIFDQLTNVHTYLGFAAFIWGCFYLCKYFLLKANSKQKRSWLVFAGIFFGLSFGLKVYAGIVALVALVAATFCEYISRKKLTLLYALVPMIMLIIGFILLTQASGSGLTFAPGWLLDRLFQDRDRLGWWPLLTSLHDWPIAHHLSILLPVFYLILTAIYLIGNLGARLSGLLLLLRFNLKRYFNPITTFFFVAVSFSILLPLLFKQTNSPHNIIQFAPYALMLSSLLAIKAIETDRISTKRQIIIGCLIVFSALPTTFKTWYVNIHNPRFIVTSDEMEALTYLQTHTKITDVILTDPNSQHSHFMIIPGLAGRQTYFSGDTFAELTGINVSDRIKKSKEFFTSMDQLQQLKFLGDAKIDYLYLDEATDEGFKENLAAWSLIPVFNNTKIVIFKVHP
jgi:hypothetical protein